MTQEQHSQKQQMSQQMSQSELLKKGGNHAEYTLRSLDFTETLFLVQTTQVAIGLFSLPRVVSEKAHHDGWMAILIAGAAVQLSIVVILVLMRRFRSLDLYGIFKRLFGKWVGNVLGALFALYCISVAATVTRAYIEIVQTWLFPTTQTQLFYLILIIPCVYCATGGIRVLGRFAITTFFATIWMMLILIAPLKQIQTEYYFPLFDASMTQMMKATWAVSTSAIGFELLLVYYPFIQNKRKAMLSSSIGAWFTTFIYLSVTLVAIGFYSERQITEIISPTLNIFKFAEIPLIERLEHIGIATWSFLIVNTASTYMWAAGRYLMTFHKWKEPTCTWLFVPLLIAMGLLPQDVYLLDKYELYLGTVGGSISLLLPLFLLLCAIVLRKKGDKSPPATLPKEANAS